MKRHEAIKFARSLRRNSTISEIKAWNILRNRRLNGIKFLRQHPLCIPEVSGEYRYLFPDFYCAQYRLIVELDGPIHNFQKEKDFERDTVLKSHGYVILRFKNEEVNNESKFRLRIIKKISELATI